MYGKHVYVTYKNKLYQVFVTCSPKTPLEELKKRAIEKLKYIEEKYSQERFEWALQRMNDGYQV